LHYERLAINAFKIESIHISGQHIISGTCIKCLNTWTKRKKNQHTNTEITRNKYIRYNVSISRSRKARVRRSSIKFLLGHDVHQGGVLSPTLFLIFINVLVSELPRVVNAALYADGLLLGCKEEHVTTAAQMI